MKPIRGLCTTSGLPLQGLQPSEKETSELRDHVIIAGFGRVGQIIAQLLSERLIPFVALDVSAERVQVGVIPHRLATGRDLIVTNSFNGTMAITCKSGHHLGSVCCSGIAG